MKKEIFTKNNFMNMDPMHDSRASKIYNEGNTLIIVYENLDNGVLAPDGNPYYKNKKLTIKYECEKYSEVFSYFFDITICSNKKYKFIEFDEFIKNYKKCYFISFKFAIDSFGGLTLYFDAIKKIVSFHDITL